MSLLEGTKLNSVFHTFAAGLSTIVPAAVSYKTGLGEPFAVAVMGLAGYLVLSANTGNISRAVGKVLNGLKSIGF